MRFVLTLVFLVLVSMTSQTIVHGPNSRSLQLAKPKSALHQRRLSFAAGFNERQLGIKLPKKMCAPAASAGAFILEQIVKCAIKMLIPGAGVAGAVGKVSQTALKVGKAAVAAGKMASKKLGLMAMLEKKQHELAGKVMGLLLSKLGCPKKRRLNFFKKLGKAVNKTVKKAKKVAKNVKSNTDKAGKNLKKEADKAANNAKKAAINIKKNADKAVKNVAKQAQNVAKNVGKVANNLAKNAKKCAKVAGAFAKKYGSQIMAVACVVIAKTCKPACSAAVTGIGMVAARFGIPIACASDALILGCNKLCEVLCKKRRLMIRSSVAY